MDDAFRGKRYTVMGLGVLGGGTGVAHYLAEHGAKVIVTDMRPPEDLQQSIQQLSGLPIAFHLGGHDDRDFTAERADVVVRNPGVRRDSRYLALARSNGVAVEMEMSLFFRACPARTIGVTGTKGKTTVTALIGSILRTWNKESFIAGNMGISAMEGLNRLTPDTPVAIELSSWQLEAMNEHRLNPTVSVITNFSEDHLDRYDGFEDYVETKRSIAHHQRPGDVVVFNNDDPHVAKVRRQSPARAMPFGVNRVDHNGAWVEPDSLVAVFDGVEARLPLPDQLSLSGAHGRMNALAAIAATLAYGVPPEVIAAGVEAFRGVENRMEEIGEVNGVSFVNDTSSTAPVATVAALQLLAERPGRVHLITGGADKQSDLVVFLDAIARGTASVALLPGTATGKVMQGLLQRGVTPFPVAASMHEAVSQAFGCAQPGDTILLSPGLASFGLFRNEFDRGAQFRQSMKDLSAGDHE